MGEENHEGETERRGADSSNQKGKRATFVLGDDGDSVQATSLGDTAIWPTC